MKTKKNARRTSSGDSLVGKRGGARTDAESVDKAQLESSSKTAAKIETVRLFNVDVVHRFGKNSGNK